LDAGQVSRLISIVNSYFLNVKLCFHFIVFFKRLHM
jgi:tRNA threonylcarbamoyladenosine modification (KEOPS) complex  Pcc1 subunit